VTGTRVGYHGSYLSGSANYKLEIPPSKRKSIMGDTFEKIIIIFSKTFFDFFNKNKEIKNLF
jgi:hypothetical protein